jgi:PAS domain S-box-containing protein
LLDIANGVKDYGVIIFFLTIFSALIGKSFLLETAMAYNEKILIVDDERRICDSLKDLLSTRGYEIKTCCNGQDALECLTENTFDLVLLDIAMEERDGFQVMERMATNHPDIMVIIMTGNASTASAVEALRKGAYDYLRKPFEPEELFTSVKNALHQQMLKKDNYRAKKKLSDREEHFKTLFNQASDCIFIIDPTPQDGPVIVDANEAACAAYGYTHDEFAGKPFLSIHTKDAGKNYLRKAALFISEEHLIFESEHLRKDGTIFPVEVSARMIHIGSTPFIYSVERSITDRKRAEEALRKSEDWLKSIFRVAPIGIGVVKNRILQDANPRLCEMTGYTQNELIGTSARLLYPTREEFEYVGREKYRQIAEMGTGAVETRFMRKDGTIIDVLLASTPMDLSNLDAGVTFSALDITERKQIESHLQQAQKMEAIGTLAGGIAHDFNNILYPLLGFAELLKEDLPADSPHQTHINEILGAALRSRDLVKQILAFSHKGEKCTKPIHLHPIVHEALKLLRSSIPTTIDIQQDIDAHCGIVMADPTQVHQIIMNLATNAYHAMEDTGGKLNVSLREVDLTSASDLMIKPAMVPGKYARLTVSDTGTGVDKTIRKKIFDPYFTTKGVGKGTGLGLSVVQGIVKAHKGDILIDSRPGKGTDVHVYLPIIDQTTEINYREDNGPIPGGKEKILLVDDEEAIVRLAKQTLESLGYQVEEKSGSIEALKAFKTKPTAFDLVLTDMTMPIMTGDQLAKELISIRQDIPIIICTGFNEKIDSEKAKASGAKGFIMKPIIKAELAKIVRKVLDDDRGRIN